MYLIDNNPGWPDNTRVYTFHDETQSADLYPLVMILEQDSVPVSMVDWCRYNCNLGWAWWFSGLGAVMGFVDRHEAFAFWINNSDQ
jgi:hypothetical protein